MARPGHAFFSPHGPWAVPRVLPTEKHVGIRIHVAGPRRRRRGRKVNEMTHQERERETIRRLREEWETAHRAERLRQRETEARAQAAIRLDEEAQVLYELAQPD